jgi:guanylate kinase
MTEKSRVLIISAPSGAGKSTLVQLLLERFPSLLFSISHTTRPPRKGEKDGVEYFFVDRNRFEEMIRKDEFLEWARVHDHYYGTSRQMLLRAQSEARDLLLDIDVQGAEKVRRALPDSVSIFLMPPSYKDLLERIRKRQKDTPEQVQNRIANAREEIKRYDEYRHIVLNDEVEAALGDLSEILRIGRPVRQLSRKKINAILKSFRES